MIAVYIHSIDPILGQAGPLYLWWYGLCYAAGFAALHGWLRLMRHRLGLGLGEVYRLTLYAAVGVLLGGRLVEVLCYEWSFYSDHLRLIPAYWLGGMATHGLLLGGVTGAWLFCRRSGRAFLPVADALVIPAAILMGLGRLGNFVDGQIVGSLTAGWWGVKFPDADGFRHPVVLYDGLKNLAIAVALFTVRPRLARAGQLTAHFILWYGLLRIPVDLFREYPSSLLGFATGQWLNVMFAVAGLFALAWIRRAATEADMVNGPVNPGRRGGGWYRLALVGVAAWCLIIPSDWTQDVPNRYLDRHPGLSHSVLYPPLDEWRGE